MRYAWTRRIVLAALTAIAGCVFLVSMLNPFVNAFLWPLGNMRGIYSAVIGEFWSFKGVVKSMLQAGPAASGLYNVSISEYWFADCWSLGNVSSLVTGLKWSMQVDGPGMSVLILVFVSQVLTLAFMVSSLFIRKFTPLLLLGTVIFSLTSILGMWLFSQLVHRMENFEAGYWLTIISAVLFSAIFLTSLILTPKRESAHT
jgi:hypothetical protein